MNHPQNHDTTRVNDPSVMGLSMRCTMCGACDCHTPHLMDLPCETVVNMNPATFMHQEPDQVDELAARRQGSENVSLYDRMDALDRVNIRKVALECSVRMARNTDTERGILERAKGFADWIQNG